MFLCVTLQTCRLRGFKGILIPAISEILPAHAPAALMNISALYVSLGVTTDVNLSSFCRMVVTSVSYRNVTPDFLAAVMYPFNILRGDINPSLPQKIPPVIPL